LLVSLVALGLFFRVPRSDFMADISGQECSFRFAAMGVAHGDEGFEDFGDGGAADQP